MKYFLTIMILAVALQSIAALCPEVHGVGVYHARSFLEYQGDFTYSELNCSDAGQRNEPATTSSEESMRIFPNPSTGFVQIRFAEKNDAPKTLSVYNANGREMLSRKIGLQQKSATLDLSDFSSGVYLIKSSSEEGKTEIQKVVLFR